MKNKKIYDAFFFYLINFLPVFIRKHLTILSVSLNLRFITSEKVKSQC